LKPAKIVIKKYENRRLYDTSASRYINLEEVAALVRDGTEVQVLDAKTGEDLTHVTLTQIIVENAKGKPTGLPLELLRQLVMASDHAGQEFISWYMKSAFETYQKLQGAIQGGLSEMQSAPSLSPLSMVKKFVQGTAAPARSESSELEELKARLAEMEARLKKPNLKNTKKKSRPRKPRQPAS
jgi:polyhydroxyalkanoate synthesis repressor PhaR